MNRKKLSKSQKINLTGWWFLVPAMILITCFSLYPMVNAFITSLKTGTGTQLSFCGLSNYIRAFQDDVFVQSILNCIFYLVLQVPIMLILALVLASALNNPNLRFRGVFRTCIFLPCATSLVAYAIVFRSLFATDGFINSVLMNLGIIKEAYNFLSNPTSAKIVIVVALIWRWTGYNMVFYLAALQNIDASVYEAAKVDGASPVRTFFHITLPLLKPTILMTAIMSTNGTLQLFDESMNLTSGGPGNASITMSHYIYNTAFKGVPNFGYTSAMSFVILIMVAVLAYIQMRVGDDNE
ncbi:MAG: sugar ABC transporter permease [Lachnospiraceae bacterium]|nr:sugar ABC transporter permease [Lachnospiraceae bacterium]